jgi:hypothetical protein
MPKLVYGLFAQKMPKSVEKEKSPQNQIWFRRFRHFPLYSAALQKPLFAVRHRLTKTAMDALSILARFFPHIQTSKISGHPSFLNAL